MEDEWNVSTDRRVAERYDLQQRRTPRAKRYARSLRHDELAEAAYRIPVPWLLDSVLWDPSVRVGSPQGNFPPRRFTGNGNLNLLRTTPGTEIRQGCVRIVVSNRNPELSK